MSDPVRTVSIRYDRGALSIIGSAYLGTTADNAVDRIQLSNTPAGATATLVYGISIRSDGRLVVPEQELGDDESVLVNADVMRACTSGALPVRLRLDWTETGADGNPVTRRVMTEPVTLEVRPASPGSDTSRPETLTAAMTRISSWAWVETLTYKAGSIVAHGGRAWTSLQASNRGHEPVLGSEWWATFDADEETLAGLRDAISAEASAREAGDGAVKDAVYTSLSTEAADRQSADGKLREDLDAEISARTAAVSDEASLRDAGDAALSARITAEQAERSAADTDEANTRASADDALRASISDNASAISAEVSARKAADSAEASARAKAVSDEASTRASADSALQTAVDGKAPIAHASTGTEYGVGSATQYGHVRVDTALSSTSTNPVQNKVVQSALAAKQGTLTWDTAPTAGSANPVTSGGVKTAIDAEATARKKADTALGKRIDAEASARAKAVSDEASARASAVSSEASMRASADTALGARIDALGSASGKDVGTASGQVPILGSGGKLDNSVIPALAISQYLGVVASAGALTGLTGQKGDYAVVSGTSATSGTYIISDNDGSSASDWVRISGPTDITPGDGIVVSGSVVGLASSGVTAGTYGWSSAIPQLTIDAYGRVTKVSTVAPADQRPTAGTGIAVSGRAVSLATSGVTAGTYGSNLAVPRLVIDAHGRVTGASTQAIYPPTTAGTAGQLWQSVGSGQGVWQTLDTAPTADSVKAVTSGGVKAAIDAEASARKEADSALQTAVGEKLHSINGVQGDGKGDVKILSGDDAIVITNDQIGHKIEVSLDDSKLPSAAVSSVNGETGAVVLNAGNIPTKGNANVQTDIDVGKAGLKNCIVNIITEREARQNADAALRANINAAQGRITTAESKNSQQDIAIAALQTADGQNVKISRINEYAIGLTGNQNSTGIKSFSAIKTPYLEMQNNFRPVIYYGNYDASDVQTETFKRIRPITVFASSESTERPIFRLETFDNASVIGVQLTSSVYNSSVDQYIAIYIRKSDGMAYATAPSRGSTNAGDYSSNEVVTIDTLRKLGVIQ